MRRWMICGCIVAVSLAAACDSDTAGSGLSDAASSADTGHDGVGSASDTGLTAHDAALPGDVGPMPDAGSADVIEATDTVNATDAGVPDAGAPGPTWDDPMADFFVSYCVACHSASPKDFNSLDDVKAWAEKSRCGVAPTLQAGCGSWPPPNQFPVGDGPKPTVAERQLLVDWVDAGMPE